LLHLVAINSFEFEHIYSFAPYNSTINEYRVVRIRCDFVGEERGLSSVYRQTDFYTLRRRNFFIR